MRFRQVAHSQTELDGVHEAVLRDRALLRKLGIDFISVSTSVVDNVVDVGVGNPGDQVQTVLEERYGAGLVRALPAIRPSTSACNTRENCANPLKGGLTIVGPLLCTSAFIGKTAAGNYLMYTAGHCGAVHSAWTHNGIGIGRVTAESYQDNSSADAGVIDIPNAQKSNLVMSAEGPAFGYTSITSKKALGVVVGTGLCKSGATSDYDCGVVTDNDWDGDVYQGETPTHMLNQIRMTIQCQGGDSGGPVWVNSKAYGILSACFTTSNGLYTQIAAAEAVLAVPVYFGN